jgi:AraC-like DNA-binding protein
MNRNNMRNMNNLSGKSLENDPHFNGSDGLSIISTRGKELNHPLHDHEEMELTYIQHARGAKRIIGSHIGELDDMELILTGPHLPHGWVANNCHGMDVKEVTIHFHKELFHESLLGKNQLFYIRRLFEDAKRGIKFSRAVAELVAPRILSLEQRTGFELILELFSLLHQLSVASDSRMLSDITYTQDIYWYNSRRLERAFQYMNMHFEKPITLEEVAGIANMSAASFSRFVKTHTGRTFTDNLVEIRMGHVSRMLMETTHSIAEIAYTCGFNNLANFNRIFKAQKGLTPKEFKREIHRMAMMPGAAAQVV